MPKIFQLFGKAVAKELLKEMIEKGAIHKSHIDNSQWKIEEIKHRIYFKNVFYPYTKKGLKVKTATFRICFEKTWMGSYDIIFPSHRLNSRAISDIKDYLRKGYTKVISDFHKEWRLRKAEPKTRRYCRFCGIREKQYGDFCRGLCQKCDSLRLNFAAKIKKIGKDFAQVENVTQMIKHLEQEKAIYETIRDNQKSGPTELSQTFLANNSYMTLTDRNENTRTIKER